MYFLGVRSLYHFAVGDTMGAILKGSAFESQLASDTELTKYEKEMKLRIGTTVLADDTYRTSLIREFDDAKEDSDTIKNNYVRHLTSEFRESDKDVFTTYLPFPLIDLVDHRTEDGWRRGNELDKVFKGEIKISKNEIGSIIEGNDRDEWKNQLAQLGDSKDQKKSVKNVIDEIKDRVEKYCESNYIRKSDSQIGQYLNRTIDQVINELDTKTKMYLVQMIKDMEYPVNVHNISTLLETGPYIITHPNLKYYFQNFLNRDGNRVISNHYVSENEVVILSSKYGFKYDEIYNHQIHKTVYLQRDRKIFRPFLNKEWNENIRGPFGEEKF